MMRSLFRRLRVIGPTREQIAALLLLFSIPEGILTYVEHGLGWPIHINIRPGEVFLFIAAISYGLGRVTRTHPCYDGEYLRWLLSTPWTPRKPLPQGPVHLVWEDAIVVSLYVALSLFLPMRIAAELVLAALFAYLAGVTISLWITRTSAHGYACALGMGFAVLFLKNPPVALAILAVVDLIAVLGLHETFHKLGWDALKFKLPAMNEPIIETSRNSLGWPFERMMGDATKPSRLSKPDVVLSVLLAVFWVYALSSLLPNREQRRVPLLLLFCFAPLISMFARLGIYTMGYTSPLSFWGRLFTLRWIIPRYDYVYITPFVGFVSGFAVFAAFYGLRAPEEIAFAASSAVPILVCLLGPPSLRRWRLTGGYQMSLSTERNKAEFVEAG